MGEYLSRQETVYLKVEGVFPVSQKVCIIGKEEHSCLIRYVGSNVPEHCELTVATELTSRLTVLFDVEESMVDFVGDAGLQVV